jgi:hypothetical protein
MVTLGRYRQDEEGFWSGMTGRFFTGRSLVVLAGAAILISFWLVWPGLVQYFSSGHVEVHWSRVLVGTFGFLLAAQSLVTGILLKVLEIWKAQRVPPG